ncbi:hypothetical protein [Lutibacter sp.]
MEKDIKLTKEQLQQVKDYLNNKDIEYIDLHFEVLDHIASDIEAKMKIFNLDFEIAFEKVKYKWNNSFTYKTSYWLGNANGGSKLFIDHCLKIYKPLFYKSIILLTMFLLVIYSIFKYTNLELMNFYSIYKIVATLTLILFTTMLLYWRVKLKNTQFKTSYSYLFNKNIFSNIFLVLILIAHIFDNDVSSFGFFEIFFLASLYPIIFIGNSFYKNHLKVVSKYKKALI